MADEPAVRKSRTAAIAFGFALAGALASWNPLAAPFGFFVGVGAAFLALRALSRRAGSRRLARAALALGIVDSLASLAVLLFTAGIFGARPGGERLVTPHSPAEMKELFDRSAADTAESRQRASRELNELGQAPSTENDKNNSPKGRK
jgi:hypothetical protein